ncbi:MAG: extracellular solute-binding protein [Verrucomicrobia bacterium]|nr:extracellular solute-binding protein [Verrucomicrobiota bacterium]
MKKFGFRLGMVLVWIGLIFTVLYWPKSEIPPFDERTINVFAWGDILDPTIVAQFEHETGIKVYLNYYASNEELVVKIKATGGQGYDLIVPSEYAVRTLKKEGLLKPLDHSQLHFLNGLNPALLNLKFDPGNQYSIPFTWEIYGLGISRPFFENRPLDPSWKMIFDPKVVDYKVAMSNDPVQTIDFAAYYLFGPIKELNSEQLQETVDLLIAQKKWVTAYADFRADYFLATKNCPVALSLSSYMIRAMRKFPFLGFVIPKEGTFVSVENVSIPAASKKEHLTYQLINYLYTAQSAQAHFDTYGLFPASAQNLPDLETDPEKKKILESCQEAFPKSYIGIVLASQEKIRDAWVEIKSSSD